MNVFIENLNHWGSNLWHTVWPMLWQSSLLIIVVLAFDFLLQRQLRASVRYALWLVVLVKLILPPTLALPTSPAWWLHKTPPSLEVKMSVKKFTVTYDETPLLEMPSTPVPVFIPPPPTLGVTAWLLIFSAFMSLALFVWLLVRWWLITKQVRHAIISERLTILAYEVKNDGGMNFKSPLVKLTTNSMSPAVCGLFRPTILIPQSLAAGFSDDQMRAVLLHELIHLQRRDVWVNFLQSLLQIVYWWHPLVWLANGRIRRVREEAVDDAVMLTLGGTAEIYAPTLLEVAKLALNRPLASLGLVGILESRSALRQRIERLINFNAPRKAGLTIVSLLGILVFSAVAVPMGEGPASPAALALDTPPDVPSLTLQVDPEIFKRNVQAQADKTMHATTDDIGDTLIDLLRREGVDCSPPHILIFNLETGKLTAKNTPTALEVFRQVIGQLNRADGKCELPLKNNPVLRKEVLISAQFYKLPAADFASLVSNTHLLLFEQKAGGTWYFNTGEDFRHVKRQIESSGFQPLMSPRMQLSHGAAGELFIGNNTNGLGLDCLPFIGDKSVELRLKLSITNELGFDLTNASCNTKVAISDNGGVVLLAKRNGVSGTEGLVAILNVRILTNDVPPRLDANPSFIRNTNNGPLIRSTTTSGILTNPDFSNALRELEKRTGTDDLAEPEVVKTVRPSGSVNKMDPSVLAAMQEKLSWTNSAAVVLGNAPANSKAGVGILVQDAKLYYGMGKLDESEAKLKAALALDPENKAANYYSNLVLLARQTFGNHPVRLGGLNVLDNLSRIKIAKLDVEHPSLAELVRQLNALAMKNDPQKIGVHFLVGTNAGADPSMDTNLVMAGLHLPNISLADALDAICGASAPMTLNRQLQYSIRDDSVVFSWRVSDDHQLFMRAFKIDANAFYDGVQQASGWKPSGNTTDGVAAAQIFPSAANIAAAARDFFTTLGVDLQSPPGKSVFYNDRLSVLFVKATKDDLDTIDRAIQALNQVAPQIHIKARFIEVPKGTLDGMAGLLTLTNQSNPLAQTNQPASMIGILNAENFNTELQVLQTKSGVETLADPEVIMLSGRQSQMRVTQEITVITNMVFNIQTGDSAIAPQTEKVEIGPVLDTIPYILSDGYTLNLTAIASLKQFLGYVGATNNKPVYDAAGKPAGIVIRPDFRTQQAVASVNMWDGQTLVIKRTIPQSPADLKVPIIGDVPLVGQLFQSQAKTRPEKELLIFVTATIVDPAGNRVHSDNDLPAAGNVFSPQPSQ